MAVAVAVAVAMAVGYRLPGMLWQLHGCDSVAVTTAAAHSYGDRCSIVLPVSHSIKWCVGVSGAVEVASDRDGLRPNWPW